MARSARDSIRHLGDDRHRVAITVGYDPETGRQVRIDRTIRCTLRQLPEHIEALHREFGTVSAASYGQMSIPDFIVSRLLEIRGGGRIGPLLVDSEGRRMAPGDFGSRWRRLLKPRAGYVPPLRYVELKNLRHSHSTILLDLGATMHEVSKRDGHATQRTTDAFYNRARLRTADYEVAARMDAAVASLMEERRKATGAAT